MSHEGDDWIMEYTVTSLPPTSHVTPLEQHPRLLSALDLDIDLRIKRDDVYRLAGGGIKARKIEFIMRDLVGGGYDVLVTNGGPQFPVVSLIRRLPTLITGTLSFSTWTQTSGPAQANPFTSITSSSSLHNAFGAESARALRLSSMLTHPNSSSLGYLD